MKHLGIAAHSVEGASLCLRTFCQEGFAKLGPHDHPDVTLDCIAMARSMDAWESGDYDAIRATLATTIDRLARAGAEFFVCPDNTAHRALEQSGPPFAIPGLHIAEVVAGEAERNGWAVVGVIGTRFLMEGPVYRGALGRRRIEFVIPDREDRDVIHRIIFDELVNGIFRDESRRRYVDIIERLASRGCNAVALACTEIPLLISQADVSIPVLDSTRLLARAAFEVATGMRSFPDWRGGPRKEQA